MAPDLRRERSRAPRARDALLHDPAHRDQDGPSWRRGRFRERVRRQWNPVPGALIERNADDLDALAGVIQARVGGDLEEIRARLDRLRELDAWCTAPAPDPLVRPGANAQPAAG
jgi:hypothetical protein